jgi:uncharacterized membrane protein
VEGSILKITVKRILCTLTGVSYSGTSMYSRSSTRQLSAWGIPALYAGAALVAGLTVPRIEYHFLPGLVSGMSIASATAIDSAIASGMIALTGVVFSLTFVMLQFSATAYSPRLVTWIAQDPVISHALGIFTATFLYAVAALSGIDRNGTGRVPFVSVWIVIVLLLGSVAMFISLVQQISLLQVTRMLVFTGDRGRKVITTIYPCAQSVAPAPGADDFRALPRTQTLIHRGKPCSIQAVDVAKLVDLSESFGGVIEIAVSVGDTVVELTPILHVLGARKPFDEQQLRNGIKVGEGRTFEQDPKYAIRLLVDIAIKALSPAINDPTTAVQALDQIEDLLLRLGQRQLDVGAFRDKVGKLRVIVPFPTWNDLLRLAFDEICTYGASSVQVMRRMNALLSDLTSALPEERHPALLYWCTRLKTAIARSFTDEDAWAEASQEDRQGLGVPRLRSSQNLHCS